MEKLIEEPLLSHEHNSNVNVVNNNNNKANEACERVASIGLMPNMIIYLTKVYNMETAEATNFLLLWSAATNFTPIIAAFLADSYFGRYPIIAFGSIASLLGMILLWLTTIIPLSRPNMCNQLTNNCNSPTTIHLLLLHSSFALMSIGAGGIRSSSLAFGVDQLSKQNENARIKEGYFSWYYASVGVASLLGFSVVVYIQDSMGWTIGFGVPVVLMFIATLSFFLATPFYVVLEAKKNMLTGLAQVLVASYRNRLLQLPQEDVNVNDIYYHHDKDSNLLVPTEKLRFLNKACITRNPLEDLKPDGRALNPWNLCTIEQVEDIKALFKIVPIWTTGIMMSVNVSQSSFLVLEASSMDRHIGSNFQIPPASFATFMILSLILWVILYDRFLVPLSSRILGRKTCLGAKQKMGVSLFSCSISIASLAIVENIRRGIAIDQGYSDQPEAVVNMSAFWLLPRQIIDGLAEASGVVGQTEFFLNELPQSMSSIASTLGGLGISVASLVASFILSIVDSVTGIGGKESWVSSNINKGHYDYYYSFICVLSILNFAYFLYCSKSYGPCKNRQK
ncbi:unnamed protein product [Trifolium pratense]|uniref:Uncharacterized protein n=1 Tax=Trifolium pratense TaxID=57577 RepID=A0ACB0JE27_TRIPR|nr:unnamed protein product [Trifolium pratense]